VGRSRGHYFNLKEITIHTGAGRLSKRFSMMLGRSDPGNLGRKGGGIPRGWVLVTRDIGS